MQPGRRIEDQIRELCARASFASDKELELILSELQVAMNEYGRRLENKLSAVILHWVDPFVERRRKTS